jgi:hypothetical protein
LCGDNILKTIDGGTYVGIKELKTGPRIKISPNPATSDHVTIELNQVVMGSSIEISDIHGRILYHSSDAGTKNLIDTTPLGKGIFFVKLLVGNRVAAVEKFVITP